MHGVNEVCFSICFLIGVAGSNNVKQGVHITCNSSESGELLL